MVYVRDLNAARYFYADLLGFKVLEEFKCAGTYRLHTAARRPR